jgi:hypothetical protein
MASFRPHETPALLLYPQGAELAREAGASLESGDLPAPLAGLISSYVEHKFSDPEELKGTLYLNAACPLVRRLAERPPAPEALGATLTVLYQTARLFAGRMLSAREAAEAFGTLTRALDGLIG